MEVAAATAGPQAAAGVAAQAVGDQAAAGVAVPAVAAAGQVADLQEGVAKQK